MTVTTDDEDVRRAFEPGCPSNPARLRAVRELQDSGVQTCCTMTPLLLLRDPRAFAQTLLSPAVSTTSSRPSTSRRRS